VLILESRVAEDDIVKVMPWVIRLLFFWATEDTEISEKLAPQKARHRYPVADKDTIDDKNIYKI